MTDTTNTPATVTVPRAEWEAVVEVVTEIVDGTNAALEKSNVYCELCGEWVGEYNDKLNHDPSCVMLRAETLLATLEGVDGGA